MQIDGGEQVSVCAHRTQRGHNQIVGPCSQSLDGDTLVTSGIDVRLAGVFGLSFCQLVIVLVEIIDTHDDTQVRVVTDCFGDSAPNGFQLAEHGCFLAVHDDEFRIFGHLGEDTVKQMVIIVSVFAVDVMVT